MADIVAERLHLTNQDALVKVNHLMVKRSLVVYVMDKGKVKKVTFGDPNMKIKKNQPKRRSNFRSRHNVIILDQKQRQDIGLARHGDMSQEFQVDILRPFGPRILRAKMPMEYVNALNEQCDKILQDDNKRKELDESAELVGHVAEELRCDMNAQR